MENINFRFLKYISRLLSTMFICIIYSWKVSIKFWKYLRILIFTIDDKVNNMKKLVFDKDCPAKNRITVTAARSSILLYSPKKNKAKLIEEYSTLNPATNSASASGRSKGTLLVSAKTVMPKTKKDINPANTNQTLFSWLRTTSIKSSEPQKKNIGKTEKIIGISYDISWAKPL